MSTLADCELREAAEAEIAGKPEAADQPKCWPRCSSANYIDGGKWCRCCSPKPRGLILAEAVQRLLDERDGLIHATADMQREIIDRFGGPDWMTALVEESARLSALAKHKNAVTETFARLRVLRQQWSIGQIESAIQICLQESLDE